jgi:adenosine deaminase
MQYSRGGIRLKWTLAIPEQFYLAAGVPVVITTDDEGVSRIDRTHELQRAVEEFNLDWPTLVALERATLEYAFLPGASLWADARAAPCAGADPSAEPPPACAAMLAESLRARLQWSLERDLAGFEAEAARLRF